MSRGQALVELAVCAPVIALLGLGAAAAIQIVEAQAGLDAATRGAVAAAARAPDSLSAQNAAQTRFASVAAGFPLHDAAMSLEAGSFGRGGGIVVRAMARVDLGWAGLVLPRGSLDLHATASAEIDPWRSRS